MTVDEAWKQFLKENNQGAPCWFASEETCFRAGWEAAKDDMIDGFNDSIRKAWPEEEQPK